jgi:hypothetical protein
VAVQDRLNAGDSRTATVLRRRAAAAWPLILVGFLAVQAVRALPRVDDSLFAEDSAVYLLLGESLASGSGYRHLSAPGDPPHVVWPPGLPGALAALRLAGADSLPAAKLIVLLVGLAAVPVAYVVLRRRVAPPLAALITLWVALHPDYLWYATLVFSDMLYLLLSLLALLAIEASARRRGWTDRMGLVAWTATVAAYLTRSVGIVLAVPASVYLGWSKARPHWRARIMAVALLGICYCGPAFAWERWKAANLTPDFGGYWKVISLRNEFDWDKGHVAGPGDIVRRAARHARTYVRGLGGLIAGVGRDRHRSIVGLVLAGLIGVGMVQAVRTGHWLVESYLLLYAAAILAYPTARVPRYFISVLPFVLLYPAVGLASAGPRGYRFALAATAAAIVASVTTVAPEGPAPAVRRAYGEYRATAQWLATHTPADAVILCRKPSLMYLWSRRKAMVYPFSRNPALIEDRVLRFRVTHVVEDTISPRTAPFLSSWLERRQRDRTLVYTEGNTRVWRLVQRDLPERAETGVFSERLPPPEVE